MDNVGCAGTLLMSELSAQPGEWEREEGRWFSVLADLTCLNIKEEHSRVFREANLQSANPRGRTAHQGSGERTSVNHVAQVDSSGDKPSKQYRVVYAPTLIKSKTNSSWTPTLSLMDSGNMLTYVCISQQKHEEMGLSHRATNATGRAAASQSLTIIGISEPLELRFASIDKIFYISPLVVQYLNSPLNLGSKFNFDHNISPQVPTTNAMP